MDEKTLFFFAKKPESLPLYEQLEHRIQSEIQDVSVKVQKTQISFYNRHMFAMASPPVRRRKEWPKEFMMVSFGLSYQVDSPRIAMSTEAYPNRWTHHVLVEGAEAIDGALLGWIDEAYRFSESK